MQVQTIQGCKPPAAAAPAVSESRLQDPLTEIIPCCNYIALGIKQLNWSFLTGFYFKGRVHVELEQAHYIVSHSSSKLKCHEKTNAKYSAV